MSDLVDPLGMSTEEMRRLGHRLVDLVVDGWEARDDGPAIRAGDRSVLEGALGGPVPRAPGDAWDNLRLLVEECLPHMQHGDHRRYFARVPGPSSFAGVLGDWLSTGFNAIAASWGGGAGPSALELIVVGWLAELLGLPRQTEGIVLSGGSLANLTALAVVTATRGTGRVYLSVETHSSLRRALRMLGVADEDIQVLPVDRGLRLRAGALGDAIAEDRRAGRVPRVVIATAGTTNTGAVDELPAIADLCASEDLWLHVDGAYGAPVAITASGRTRLEGIDRADSLTLDPHKWLFTPYDAAVLLVRQAGLLERTFAMRPAYLADARGQSLDEVDFGTRGPELTRRARALKLWMVMRTYGVDAIADAIDRGLALAESAERMIRADPWWAILTPASLGIVTFAHRDWSADAHAASAAAIAATGFAAVTSTTVHERPALRLCTINPLTTEADLAETLDRLRSINPSV